MDRLENFRDCYLGILLHEFRKAFGKQDDEFGAGHADILRRGLPCAKRQSLDEAVPVKKRGALRSYCSDPGPIRMGAAIGAAVDALWAAGCQGKVST